MSVGAGVCVGVSVTEEVGGASQAVAQTLAENLTTWQRHSYGSEWERGVHFYMVESFSFRVECNVLLSRSLSLSLRPLGSRLKILHYLSQLWQISSEGMKVR